LAEVGHVTRDDARTSLSRSKGQGHRGHIVAASRTACYIMTLPPYGRGIKAMLLPDICLSDVCLSCTSSLTLEQRPRKTKIGTEIAHITCD